MILQKINQYKILLASNSPRRRELLSALGIQFEVITGNKVDETIPPEICRKQAAEYLAVKKNKAYRHIHTQNTILITADTTVLLGDTILDKPKDPKDAEKILQKLSGKQHEVRTGVCISTQNNEFAFTEISKVFFAKPEPEEIQYYLDNYKPYDKAGAYGVQEWIGHALIEKIEGSYDNIVGLPAIKLYQTLKHIVKKGTY